MEKLTQPQPNKDISLLYLLKKQMIFSAKLYFEPLVLFWRYIKKPYDKIWED